MKNIHCTVYSLQLGTARIDKERMIRKGNKYLFDKFLGTDIVETDKSIDRARCDVWSRRMCVDATH